MMISKTLTIKTTFTSVFAGITFLICSNHPAIAHNVKTDADVGATFHIEPNHNPRAQEATQAWFALTSKGGKFIPLGQCSCQLKVYPQGSNSSILTPNLTAISVEQYQDIPSAEIVFPQAGIYTLEISGTPQSGANFQPFKLSYNVTVSPGKTSSTPEFEVVSQPSTTSERRWLPYAGVGVFVIGGASLLSFRGK